MKKIKNTVNKNEKLDRYKMVLSSLLINPKRLDQFFIKITIFNVNFICNISLSFYLFLIPVLNIRQVKLRH